LTRLPLIYAQFLALLQAETHLPPNRGLTNIHYPFWQQPGKVQFKNYRARGTFPKCFQEISI